MSRTAPCSIGLFNDIRLLDGAECTDLADTVAASEKEPCEKLHEAPSVSASDTYEERHLVPACIASAA